MCSASRRRICQRYLTEAEQSGFAGLNVTFPCKQAVMAHLDELSPDARAVGAVNTVVFRNGRRVGHNTDWTGFFESFRRGLGDAGRDRVVQFGAGGAGAAVAHALLTLDTGQVAIVDTDTARAQDLAGALCARFGAGRAVAAEHPADAVAAADGLVNTTPVGMAKFPGMVVAENWLRRELWVADIVYFPLETELLRVAQKAWLPDDVRRRHGRIPGGAGIRAVLRHRARRSSACSGILNGWLPAREASSRLFRRAAFARCASMPHRTPHRSLT